MEEELILFRTWTRFERLLEPSYDGLEPPLSQRALPFTKSKSKRYGIRSPIQVDQRRT